MEIQERVRGVVLMRVHSLGGSLVRLGEGLQTFARPLELAGAQASVELPAQAELVTGPAVDERPAAPKPAARRPKRTKRR